MRDIDELLPQVLPFAPNCPEPVALRFIREAARKMCHDIRLWREYDTTVVSGPECTALLTIPDAEIVEIQAATINGHRLDPVTIAWLDSEHPGWDRPAEITAARYITQLNPKTVAVSPREEGELTARYVLQPSMDCLEVPDTLVDLHAITLGKGAAARILMMPAVDFANPQLGSVLLGEFDGLVASLKTEHTKGQQGARLRTKGDWF